MEQLTLPMLTLYTGPRLVAPDIVASIHTYREAVRACWALRTRRNVTKAAVAQAVGCYASHMSDYTSGDDAKRELPAKHIAAFEVECGNRVITQWLNARAQLTIMEAYLPAMRISA